MSIQESRDQCSFDSSPGLFAVFHALHRLLAPRHPPHALSSLAALIQSSAAANALVVDRSMIRTTDLTCMGQVKVTIHLIFSRARVEILKKLTSRGPCHDCRRLMQLSYHYLVVKEQSGFPKR